MFILNKKSKILFAVAGFVALVGAGLLIEATQRDAFIIEPVAEEDRISYVEEDDMVVDNKVNLNTADVGTLSTLYGIDENLGERIISYREEHGRFETVEEIMNVPGIGRGRFDKIKDNIIVEQ